MKRLSGKLGAAAKTTVAVRETAALRPEIANLLEKKAPDAESFAAVLKTIAPAKGTASFRQFCRVMNESWPSLSEAPDPDLAVRHLERFVEAFPEAGTSWETLAGHPEGMKHLFAVFGSSLYLSEILIMNPGLWEWVRERNKLAPEQTRRVLAVSRGQSWDSAQLRSLRNEETLRLALAELVNDYPVSGVAAAFSELADFIIERVLFLAEPAGGICALGLGKLGGQELNYSSDIDLMFLAAGGREERATRAVQAFVNMMEEKELDAFLYRVDLRLRPHGQAGNLILGARDYLDYYRKECDVWEYQALIKARAVAGEKKAGEALLKALTPLIYRAWTPREFGRLREIKRKYEAATADKEEETVNVKMGTGGIRDIEFTVQALQLRHGGKIAGLRTPNHLAALEAARRHRLLKKEECSLLRENYLFFRSIENRIQLYQNRQAFNLPSDPPGLKRLARSLGFRDTAGRKTGDAFLAKFKKAKERCREIFERVFYDQRVP
jgi:glutamate-ammonia-ligase adenylyltransferase